MTVFRMPPGCFTLPRKPQEMALARIFIVGSGVVGTATGKGFIEAGHTVTFIDVALARLECLRAEGFDARFALDLPDEPSYVFMTLPTPNVGKSFDLSAFTAGTRSIADAVRRSPAMHTIVVRSTVPPGTTEGLVLTELEFGSGKQAGIGFALASNPEFLRAATAAEDFRHPWMTVIASRDEATCLRLRELLAPFGGELKIFDDPAVAETIKCAHNLFNAAKISFWNEMWLVTEQLGIDHDAVVEHRRQIGGRLDQPVLRHPRRRTLRRRLPAQRHQWFLGFCPRARRAHAGARRRRRRERAAGVDQQPGARRPPRSAHRAAGQRRMNPFLWLLLLAYFRPLFEMVLLLTGEWWFHTRFQEDRSKFSRYVIQITSVGKELDRVNEIVERDPLVSAVDELRDLGRHRARLQHRLPERRPRHRGAAGVRRRVAVQVPRPGVQRGGARRTRMDRLRHQNHVPRRRHLADLGVPRDRVRG